MDILKILGRDKEIFDEDVLINEDKLREQIKDSRVLIIGAAGSIGQSVTKEILKRKPKLVHLLDISENNLVELIRDIRSSSDHSGLIIETFCFDICSDSLNKFFDHYEYDYVLNLSALKHVRSERDPFTLMRMIDVNIFSTEKLIRLLRNKCKKYFSVSTDKATNPVNLMGASKLVMENLLLSSQDLNFSSARFANVAFSDGSLLHGFINRINKNQPLAAPNDIKRYFVTPKESGQLCMMSTFLGKNRDIFFPKDEHEISLTPFSDIAIKFLESINRKAVICSSEFEARNAINTLNLKKEWPCYFFQSDTTGEKPFEEFFSSDQNLDLNSFLKIGIIKNKIKNDFKAKLILEDLNSLKSKYFTVSDIKSIFQKYLHNFSHIDTGKSLDSKM